MSLLSELELLSREFTMNHLSAYSRFIGVDIASKKIDIYDSKTKSIVLWSILFKYATLQEDVE